MRYRTRRSLPIDRHASNTLSGGTLSHPILGRVLLPFGGDVLRQNPSLNLSLTLTSASKRVPGKFQRGPGRVPPVAATPPRDAADSFPGRVPSPRAGLPRAQRTGRMAG